MAPVLCRRALREARVEEGGEPAQIDLVRVRVRGRVGARVGVRCRVRVGVRVGVRGRVRVRVGEGGEPSEANRTNLVT